MIVPWTLLLTVLPYFWVQIPVLFPLDGKLSAGTLFSLFFGVTHAETQGLRPSGHVCVSSLLCWAWRACGTRWAVPRVGRMPGCRTHSVESPWQLWGPLEAAGSPGGSVAPPAPEHCQHRFIELKDFIVSDRIVFTSGTQPPGAV